MGTRNCAICGKPWDTHGTACIMPPDQLANLRDQLTTTEQSLDNAEDMFIDVCRLRGVAEQRAEEAVALLSEALRRYIPIYGSPLKQRIDAYLSKLPAPPGPSDFGLRDDGLLRAWVMDGDGLRELNRVECDSLFSNPAIKPCTPPTERDGGKPHWNESAPEESP